MKKFLALINILTFALLLGGAASFTADMAFHASINPVNFAAGSIFIGGILNHYNMLPINVAAITMSNITKSAGDNIGGTTGTGYIAEISTFTTITEPVEYSAATSFTELAENDTPFVFATGGRFYECYITPNKGKLDYKEQGEEDGKSYKPEGEIFVPGDDIATMGFLTWMKNNKFILLKKMANKRVHQIGTKDAPCTLVGEWTSATNSSGVKGSTIKYSTAYASGPIIYTAAISLTPAV